MSSEFIPTYFCYGCGAWINPETVNPDDASDAIFCEFCRASQLSFFCHACNKMVLASKLTAPEYARAIKTRHFVCPKCRASRKVRTLIAQTRALSGRCEYCGNIAPLTRDHIIPRVRGGTMIARVCSQCNSSKKSLGIYEWLSMLPPNAPQHAIVPSFLADYKRYLSEHQIMLLESDRSRYCA